MPAMKMNASRPAVDAQAAVAERGLPAVKYRPAVTATLLAAVFIWLVMIALAVAGAFNVVSFSSNTEGREGTTVGTVVCGLLTIVALAGVGYFGYAIVKGVRDLGEQVYFTRGTAVSGDKSGRRNNWLIMSADYAGPDMEQAAQVSEEQRAASVDRSQIFQPRFTPGVDRKKQKGDADDVPVAGIPRSGGYLSAERIAASSANMADLERKLDEQERAAGPRAVFRIDFASKAKLQPGEEVLVAHSPHLQHVFYVARLKDGEWETYRNRSLI